MKYKIGERPPAGYGYGRGARLKPAVVAFLVLIVGMGALAVLDGAGLMPEVQEESR